MRSEEIHHERTQLETFEGNAKRHKWNGSDYGMRVENQSEICSKSLLRRLLLSLLLTCGRRRSHNRVMPKQSRHA
jgi:hypothetical protein